MSSSRCLRCALDAVQPFKRVHLQAKPSTQIRQYASAPPSKPVAELSYPGSLQTGQNFLLENPKRSKPKSEDAVAASPRNASREDTAKSSGEATAGAEEESSENVKPFKMPTANVLATYRTPVRYKSDEAIVASLQLRSFHTRNLEFFADFAMRVAQYLKLSASGPMPLPKRIERWTVLRSNFIFKKSQENFERITLRRLITIRGGHKDAVEVWLACLRKWQFYGVGMKANVWENEGLDIASKMDKERVEIEEELDRKLANFGWTGSAGDKSIEKMLERQGANVPGSPMSQVREEIRGAKNIDLFRDVQ